MTDRTLTPGTKPIVTSKSLAECSPDERRQRITAEGWDYAGKFFDKYHRRIPFDSLDIACAYMDGLEAGSEPHESETSEQPVAYVPIHPRTGPLWANTVPTLESERPSHYPVMALYAAHTQKACEHCGERHATGPCKDAVIP